MDARECQKSEVNWLSQQPEVTLPRHSDRRPVPDLYRVLELYRVLGSYPALSVQRVVLDWHLDLEPLLLARLRWDLPLVCQPHSDLL